MHDYYPVTIPATLFMNIISFDHVSKTYSRGESAIEDINLAIAENEFLTIVGQSGAGKSTLLKLIIAEERPTTGKVVVDKIDVGKMKPQHLPVLRRKIGMIFQDFKLIASKTVFENISFAMEVAGKSTADINRDVPQILKLIGLTAKARHFPSELSGGEKQRVAIGRALAHKPNILMADEPTGNLDPLNTWDVINLLVKINEIGTTVILATHDREIINTLSKRMVRLDKGRIVQDEKEGKFII